jgi:hypothetical protein
MLNLEVKTKQNPEKVVEKLKAYFGEDGLGLELKSDTPQCLNFEGAGGYVTAVLCPEEETTRVELETREWEYHVKKFAADLH